MIRIKQLHRILWITFGAVPVVAGLDKFFNLLTQWGDYIGSIKGLIPFDLIVFMKMVGIIEIIAGLIVFVKPLIGAYVVMAWLFLIAIQLIMGGIYLDVAVRDLVMATGAYSLAQLTKLKMENNIK